ncbi:MAG: NADH-dependent [FeFe] hydrogenase, group A6 [Firmicutes bacterium]|nr:NADH-dependent [FeFe] hydrogenase, group A6 [Bacillota bacterium]MDY5532013.1 NADH-dependent [FeFe] hydrogenase, group A6 [Pumilibacteraceae bacterium]
MKNVTLKINNTSVTVPEGTRILDAARQAGFDIPTLCYLKDVTNEGSCRMCVVEVKGARSLVVSCVGTVAEGMEVFTNTPKVIASRKTTLELMLSNHKRECLSCVRSTNCELQKLALEYGCDDKRFEGEHTHVTVEAVNPYLVRDNDKCILCRRCVAMCSKIQSVGVIGANRRGFNTEIGCAFNRNLGDVDCVACGQCIKVCPTGALTEVDDTDKVIAALNDPNKYVIFGTAPSVRVALGEEFGNPIGTDSEGKMVAAIKRMGADKVFDVNMTADLTIMEEGTELLQRLSDKNAVLPMITSCSPGWIRFIEFNYPELLGHLSSCKSPQQMFGAVMKTYYAQANNIDPKDIYVVSCMPCTAKKAEILRDDQAASGYPDIDVVLTTRELARLIKKYGINFNNLPNEQFDDPIGYGTTAGLIFGATGGVMEAALRTVSELVTGKALEKLDFEAVRGVEGIKEATVTLGDKTLKVAAVNTLSKAREVMEQIKRGECDYTFIEIMACPGGCVNGGGQPIVSSELLNKGVDPRALRAAAIYKMDKNSPIRKSHENPVIKKLYAEYFEKPGSHKAHEILHTTYVKREKM